MSDFRPVIPFFVGLTGCLLLSLAIWWKVTKGKVSFREFLRRPRKNDVEAGAAGTPAPPIVTSPPPVPTAWEIRSGLVPDGSSVRANPYENPYTGGPWSDNGRPAAVPAETPAQTRNLTALRKTGS